MGPQILPGPCSSVGSPWDHSLLRASTCSSVGSSTGWRWISAPPWTSMDCRGTAYLTIVLSTGCREICAPAPGACPPLSSLTLVSAQLFFSHSLLFLTSAVVKQFFLLLNYVIIEVQPPSLNGLALASGGSVLEPAGTDCNGCRGSF